WDARPMTIPVAARPGPAIRPAPFASVGCGIHGSRADLVAATQAASLARPTGKLTLLAAACEVGVGLTAQAGLSRAHAQRALERAADVARDGGACPRVEIVETPDARDALLCAATTHELLVLGT